jgi:hypothetical protein
MGACGVSGSFPGKTFEQAKKLFDQRVEQSLYEDGHNYSGCIGMLSYTQTSLQIFDTLADFEDAWSDLDKGVALFGQVRVIRETKPLIAAQKARNAFRYEADLASGRGCAGNKGRVKGKDGQWKPGTPAQLKRVLDKWAKLDGKYQALVKAQAAKSTKTVWHFGGWASS